METIYEDKSRSLKLTVDRNYDKKFLEFTANILWGTSGILYKKNNIEDDFKRYKDPLFFSLTENDELIGIRIINHREAHQNNITFDIFYRSLLAIRPDKMSQGYGTLILDKITEYIFNKFEKVMLFAHVEENNKRSGRAVHKANFTTIATFLALSHIRIMPKSNRHVTKLDKNETSVMLSLLNNQYAKHSFVDINESFDAESYYVYKENNEIKAGLQVKVLSWSFVNFPGFYGFFLMNIVPKIPVIKKIFDPKNHLFLKIGNAYISDSKSFSKLLDAVLSKYKFNTSLTYLNPNSDVDSIIINIMKKGILSSTASKVHMFCKTKNISVEGIGVTQANCFFSNF